MKFPACGARREKLLPKIPSDYFQLLNLNIECSLEEAQSIYNKFRILAPSGRLYLKNFQECLGLFGTLGRLIAERMFRAFDANNDESLDFVEFSSSLLIMTRGSEEKKLALGYRIIHPNPKSLPHSLVGSLDMSRRPSDSNQPIPPTIHSNSAVNSTNSVNPNNTVNQGNIGDQGNSVNNTVDSVKSSELDNLGDKVESNVENSVNNIEHDIGVNIRKNVNSDENIGKNSDKVGGGEVGLKGSSRLNQIRESLEHSLSRGFIRMTTQSIINTTRLLASNLGEVRSSRVSEADFALKADKGIAFPDFLEVVNDIALTKALLVCREPKYFSAEEVRGVFERYASASYDGSKRLTQSDYANAVCESSEFLELLGVSLSQFAMETVTTSYRGVDMILRKINATTRGYVNRTHMRRKNVYKWINEGEEKRGLSVHFGHGSWNHVVNMMIGLSISARYVYSQTDLPLSDNDYALKLCFSIEENSEGLKVTKYLTTTTGLSSSLINTSSNPVNTSSHTTQHTQPSSHTNSNRVNNTQLNNMDSLGNIGDRVELGEVLGDRGETSDSEFRFSRFYRDNLRTAEAVGPVSVVRSRLVFREYAPMVFRGIRRLSGLSEREYLESVSPEQLVGSMVLGNLSTMSELVSEGKSGALFYYTINGRLILKTISKRCAKFVKQWLKRYYHYLEANPDSILTRFYGLFSTENRIHRDKVYFIVMNNVFYSKVSMHRRYDLKGSWVGRRLEPCELRDHTVALKDLDLEKIGEHITLGQNSQRFLNTLTRDVNFLKASNLLDYSLLLGIHYREQSKDLVNWDEEEAFVPGNQHRMMSADRHCIYYMGIVDLLTCWNLGKRVEHFWRVLQTRHHHGVSCVHPNYYSIRFLHFISSKLL